MRQGANGEILQTTAWSCEVACYSAEKNTKRMTSFPVVGQKTDPYNVPIILFTPANHFYTMENIDINIHFGFNFLRTMPGNMNEPECVRLQANGETA